MAAMFHLYIFIVLTIFTIPLCFAQSSPQNIETFYPGPPSPAPVPAPVNNPPISAPLAPSNLPESAPTERRNSSNNTVAKAVAATVASTLVVAGFFFFLLRRVVVARRKDKQVSANSGGFRAQGVMPMGEFGKFDRSLTGLIVDENGLDVLYWRKLEGKSKKQDSMKKGFQYSKFEEKQQSFAKSSRKKPDPVQEIPLLRGKSSSSHIVESQSPPSAATGVSIQPSRAPPPPPPPPSQSSMAIPVQKSPPPPPPNKKPLPPPPPPAAAKVNGSSSVKRPPLPKSKSGDDDQVKLKPLHWDKVNTNASEHSMVWDKIDGGSFRFDGDLMEALFGYVATKKISPQQTSSSVNQSNHTTVSPVVILDPRKSQNIAIVIKSLAISRAEIIDALNEGEELNADTLEKLTGIAPTKEEESRILKFSGDLTKLADAEAFLYHLLKAVPSAFTRLNAMLFRLNIDAEILSLKESLQTLELGCKELKSRGLFIKLLEAVLKAGNRMNAGTSRGNAQAFNLNALQKLSDVKSTNGKTTLLGFVVEEVVRYEGRRCFLNRNRSLSRNSSRSGYSSLNAENSAMINDREKEYMMLGLPVVGGLSAEFSNVKKSAAIDYNTLASTCSTLATQAAEIRKLLRQSSTDGGGQRFLRDVTRFLDAAEEEIDTVRKEQTRVMELVGKTTEYYQAKSTKDKGTNPLQLFTIVKDFLVMVDQACVEIARNLQKKKTATASSGSPPPKSESSRSDVKFANLPEHFFSDKSRSSSDSDDE